MDSEKYQKLKKVIQEANPRAFDFETTKEWEDSFYESGWDVDTLVYSEEESKLKAGLSSFLPRHMDVYDWNLPYIDEIILQIRRAYGRPIRLADVLLAVRKNRPHSFGAASVSNQAIYEEQRRNEIIKLVAFWNLLDDNLDHQSEETKQFLIDLLVE